MTTRQLREALPDIAQATLYRHVAALVDAGLLAVAEERRIRGTVERSYTLGDRLAHVDQAELATMSSAQLEAAFLAFLRTLAKSFDDMINADAPPDRRFLGFGHAMLHLTEQDLPALQAGMAELLSPYLEPASDRRRVMLSTTLIPTD